MSGWQRFPSMNRTERRLLQFNFAPEISASDSIVSGSPVLYVSIVQGTDASPMARIEGDAAINVGVVEVWFRATLRGIYRIRCVVTLASGSILELPAELHVEDGA
ncbi:MAG TPA: hypothetical protein VLC92_01200 [Rhodocyclaceae bacterium]|nr:hypothetical protein [Rhodocyclaceae bacterium]